MHTGTQHSASWVRTCRPLLQRKVAAEFGWIAAGQAATVAGTLVGVRVLTTLLPPSDYGRLALAMTGTVLVNQLIFGPLTGAATRFFAPAREARAIPAYLTALRQLALGATALLAAVLAVFLVAAGRMWHALGLATFLFALLLGYNNVIGGIQNAARQRTVFALNQGLAAWGRFLMAASFMIWMGLNSTIAMTGYGAAMLLVVISQAVFFRRITHDASADMSEPPARRPSVWRADMLTYAWPFAAWGIFTWGQMASDRWALACFRSPGEVGLYAVLYQLGYVPVLMLTNMVVQLISPMLFQHAGDGLDRDRLAAAARINRVLTQVALGLTGLAFLFVLLAHRFLFDLLVAPEYAAVSSSLPWMVLSGGLFAAGQITSIRFMSDLKPGKLARPKIVTALAGIALNLLGARYFGVQGVVGAMVLFSLLYFVWIEIGFALQPPASGRGGAEEMTRMENAV